MLSQTNVQKSVWVCSYCLCPSLWGSQRNTSFLLPCPNIPSFLHSAFPLSLSSSSSCSLRVVLAKIKEPIMKQSVFKLQKIARKREGGRTTIQCSSEEWAEIIVLISGPKSRCPLIGFDGSAHPSKQTLAFIFSQWHGDGIGSLRPNSRLHSFVIDAIWSDQFKLLHPEANYKLLIFGVDTFYITKDTLPCQSTAEHILSWFLDRS